MVDDAGEFPEFWTGLMNRGAIDELVGLYAANAVLVPTFSSERVIGEAGLQEYFGKLAGKEGLQVVCNRKSISCIKVIEKSYVLNGEYLFAFKDNGALLSFPSRFSFVIDLSRSAPILHHHSSQMPAALS